LESDESPEQRAARKLNEQIDTIMSVLADVSSMSAEENDTREPESNHPNPGRVEDWRFGSVGPAYPLLPVSVGSASLSGP
jgi:hypothetical protein